MIKKIHPAFKHFIMNNALKKWDEILKKDGIKEGSHAGVCFSTSNAFCKILNGFGISCELNLVETLIGNKPAIGLFDYYTESEDLGAFYTHLKDVIDKKGKGNLTSDDPVIIGLGMGGKEDQFHFVINLTKHKQVIDLTIERMNRPQWGIKCKNYWANYDIKEYQNGVLISEDIRNRSGYVLMTTPKQGDSAKVGVNPETYAKREDLLREYIFEQVTKRNIPVFRR